MGGLRGGFLGQVPLREGLKEKQEPAKRRRNVFQAMGTERAQWSSGWVRWRLTARPEEAGVQPRQRAPRPSALTQNRRAARPAWSSKHVVGRNETARMLGPQGWLKEEVKLGEQHLRGSRDPSLSEITGTLMDPSQQ